MSESRRSVFLERQSYRRRRMMDAARFLPLLGTFLFAVPLLWPKPEDGATISTSQSIFYIFGCWSLLILLAVLFGRKSRGWGAGSARSGPDPAAPRGRAAQGTARRET